MAQSRYELYEIPGVEIFAAGDYGNGDVVTSDTLKEIVRNHYKLIRLHTPPVGLGHDEDQARVPALLNSPARPWLVGPTGRGRSDQPAAGWCSNLRYVPDRFGGTIVADFSEVPEPVARLIESRSYRRVSSEIYTFRDGLGGVYPNTLRRVSLEGFTPPVVKRLADLPLPVKSKQYAERFAAPARTVLRPFKNSVHAGYGVTYFAEVLPVNKSAMLAAIRGQGLTLSDSAIAGMTESDVKAMYTSVCVRRFAEPASSDPAAGAATQATMGREEMIEALAAMGEDAAQLSSLSDADLQALYAKKMAESGTTAAAAQSAGGQSDTAKVYAEAASMLEQVKRYAEAVKLERKKISIDAHLDRLSREGRVTPAERPGLEVQLLEADNQEVKKFAEGTKQYSETSFDAQIRRLNGRRPVAKMGERFDAPTAGSSGTSEVDAEAEKVKRYAEDNEAAVKVFGGSPATYVADFKRLYTAGLVKSAEQFTGSK